MADGNLVMQVEDMAEGFPFMPQVAKGTVYIDRVGACDPLMREQWQRLDPFRYATVFPRWTAAGAAAPLLLSAQSWQLFANGAGETGAGTGGTAGSTNMTRAETNAYSGGGIAKQGSRFIAVALAIQTLRPFVVDTGADCIGSSATRRYAPWLKGGTDYAAEGVGLFLDATTAELQHGSDNACKYDIGPLSMALNQSGAGGYDPVQGIPGQFLYLAIPDVSGSKQDGWNLALTVTLNENLRLDSDPINATETGVNLVTPVRIAFVGFPVCVGGADSNAGACGTVDQATVQAAVQAALKAQMAAFQEMMSRMQPQGAPPALGDGKSGGRIR